MSYDDVIESIDSLRESVDTLNHLLVSAAPLVGSIGQLASLLDSVLSLEVEHLEDEPLILDVDDDEDDWFDEDEDDYYLDDEDDEDEDEEDTVATDLWANPPPPAASWPNVATPVASRPTIQWPRVSVPAPPALAPVPAASNDVLRATVGRDGRGRACCPNNLTKHVGFGPGDHVFVAERASGPGLVLLKRAPSSGLLATYTVDSDSNIRLCRGVLADGGLGSSQDIKFRTTNDGIVVVAG